MITSWSHSKLVEFDKCKYRTFLLHVKRVPEPPRELRPGQTEHANERGSRIHDEAERFVRGQLKELPYELRSFEQEFLRLRELFRQGIVSVEGNWGFNRDWTPMPWEGEWQLLIEEPQLASPPRKVKELPKWGKSGEIISYRQMLHQWHPCWHRSKLDAIVLVSEYEAVIIDYKTGKKFGNEVKHGEQLQLYALDAIMRYPKLETVTVELWYPDVNELTTVTYTRDQVLRFRKSFQRRGEDITSCTEWPANPNIFVCRYCDYGSTGDCKVSAKDAFIKGPRR